MSSAARSQQRVAVVIGLPAGIRALLERRFKGHVTIRSLLLRQDGGFRLEPPPRVAVTLLEQFAEEAASYQDALIVVLPYAGLASELIDTVTTLAELGATVVYAQPGTAPWPARSPRLDHAFQTTLFAGVIHAVEEAFPERASEEPDERIAFEILRGLVTHSKMGPNNHSGEDDLWKSRGQDLGPGGRQRILSGLLRSGILDRKRNDSAGGKGWVYWISDVAKAKTTYPALTPYL